MQAENIIESEKNLARLIRNRAFQFKDQTILKRIPIDGENDLQFSWSQLLTMVNKVASLMIEAGIKPGDRVGIFSQNMPYWTVADLGIVSAGAVSVPLYATHTLNYARYIVKDADISVMFVGEQDQYDVIEDLLKEETSLKKIVVFDPGTDLKNIPEASYFEDFLKEADEQKHEQEIEARIENIQPEDLLTLIYTSGTTGDPKGVMLTHKNIMYALSMHDERLNVDQTDRSISFLPLSHVFERAWTYFLLHKGIENNYLKNPKEVLEAMKMVKPTLMCTVPRLLEKIYEGIQNKIADAPKIQKQLFKWAVDTGNTNFKAKNQGEKPGFGFRINNSLANKLILKRLQSLFGGKIKFMPCAGSPLPDNINEFFHSIGIHVKYGYGLTETTATVSAFEDQGFNLGSIGRIFPDLEVKIGPDNEIMVKGPTVMKGYYNKPEDTAQVFEGEWFKTGDAGSMDDGGSLYFQERIKELIKTSVGKYISPQMLESIISSDRFIDQIAIFGDQRKFVTALIVPSFESLEEFARSKGISFENEEDLVHNSSVVQFFNEKINQLQSQLPSYEQVKKFRLLPKNFSLEKNEITPTLKLKRKAIEQRYRDLIDSMYKKDN